MEYHKFTDHCSEEIPIDECMKVLEILDLYRRINDAYNRLTDKTFINQDRIQFRGFDGNNEGEYLHYARFLVEQQKRWQELKGRDLNSHMPMMGEYDRMLERWKQSEDKYNLSKEDIIRIVPRSAVTAI